MPPKLLRLGWKSSSPLAQSLVLSRPQPISNQCLPTAAKGVTLVHLAGISPPDLHVALNHPKSGVPFFHYACKTDPKLQNPNSKSKSNFCPALRWFSLLSPFHLIQFIFPPIFPCCTSGTDGRTSSADGIIIAVTYALLTGRGERWEPYVLPLPLGSSHPGSELQDLCFPPAGCGCGLITGGCAI